MKKLIGIFFVCFVALNFGCTDESDSVTTEGKVENDSKKSRRYDNNILKYANDQGLVGIYKAGRNVEHQQA